ncbi:unnamed protein product [Schistosoma turkestanicum]|nr:unnamed protein product [Schistosoma turkestanicum]
MMLDFAILILMTFHLHGRTAFDTHVHILLVQAIIFAVISNFAELISDYNTIFSLIRNFWYVLVGAWLCQIGFDLYPPWSWLPMWDQDDTKSIVHVNNIFSYHMIIISLAIIIIMYILNPKREYSSEQNLRESSVKQC